MAVIAAVFSESPAFTWFVLPVLIFLARITDVSLGTVRLIFVSRGYKLLAPLVGFFEVLIWILAIGQIPFIINVFISIKGGKKITNDNPWDATTLEWATPTPPPHGNFTIEPVAQRGP